MEQQLPDVDGLHVQNADQGVPLRRQTTMSTFFRRIPADSQRGPHLNGSILRVRGLTPERVGRFEHFTADESLVSEQCIVCREDLQFDMEMVRLDCNHYLCKTCTNAWFKDHNKCPLCYRIFY